MNSVWWIEQLLMLWTINEEVGSRWMHRLSNLMGILTGIQVEFRILSKSLSDQSVDDG